MLKIKKPFIIAEIGNNHEGCFNTAKKLVIEASKTGVSAVKFQTFKAEFYINKKEKKRFNKIKKFELSNNQFIYLSKLSKDLNLKFISTPFDFESAIFLSKIVDFFKISSGDNNYFELIQKVSSFKKKIILSLGLVNDEGVKKIIKFLKKIKYLDKTQLLHCVSAYPVKYKDANLLSIKFLANKYKIPIGYSDHTNGINACMLAYALGANVLEKHFTLNKNFSNFRDHHLSADPKEMKLLVENLNQFYFMFGDLDKKITKDELKNLNNMRRSFYAKENINKNQKIKKENIKFVRPYESNSINLRYILNKTAKKNIKENQLIKKNLLN